MGSWKEKEYTYRCRFLKAYSEIYCDLPKIPIHLLRGGKIFPTEGVLDSGCSRTHIRADIAKFLGIDYQKLPKTDTHGLTGSQDGWKAKILLEVIDHGEPFEITAIIVEKLPDPITVLLGNNDFFDKFNVRFERGRQYFYVKRVK
ncbi:MAG: hypothetical protein AAB804_02105 [Patescibacteria group bacterium]